MEEIMPLSIAQIPRQLDFTRATVRNWIDPAYRPEIPRADTLMSTGASLVERTAQATGGSNKPTSMPSSTQEERGNLS